MSLVRGWKPNISLSGKKHQQLQRVRQAVAFNYKIFTVQQTIYLKSVKSRIFYRDTKSSSLNNAKVAPKLFFTNHRANNICFGLWLSCSHQSSTCKPINDILISFMKPWKQYKLSCSSNLRFIVGSRYFVSGNFCPRQRMESKEDRWKEQNWFIHKVEGGEGGMASAELHGRPLDALVFPCSRLTRHW